MGDNENNRASEDKTKSIRDVVLGNGPEIFDEHHLRIEPKESQEDAQHRRRKDHALFWFFLCALGLLFVVAFYFAFEGNAEQTKFGQVILSAIVGGGISRLLAAKQ